MLAKVTVVPPPGAFWSPLEIPVLSLDGSGVFIDKVDGLEPVAAEIVTTAYNELDGDFYVGSRAPKRNIVLHAILGGPTISVSQVRQNLYGYFMPKMNVVLQFDFSDRDPVQIAGYVESFTGDRFSNDPNADISIICPKPNFKAVAPTIVNGISEVGTNPPLTDVLNTGDRMVGMQLRIVNNSGMDFQGDIKLDRKIESSPGVYFSTVQMYLEGVLLEDSASGGHYMWVDTNLGQKVVDVRNGADDSRVRNLLGGMHDDSAWPILWAAMNKFRVVTTGTTGWGTNHLNWTLTFTYEYGGV